MKKEKKTPDTVEEVKEETTPEVSKEEELQKALDEKNDQFLRLCA